MKVLRKSSHILVSVGTFAFQCTVACLADCLLESISHMTHAAAQKPSLETVYVTQLAITCSKSTTETLTEDVDYVQSYNKDTRTRSFECLY